MPFHSENRRFTTGIIVLIASLFVIAIGVQAYVANEDNKDRDAAGAAERAAQQEYDRCLSDFASDLVDSLQNRSEASQALLAAGERKDHALDRLITISAQVQASGAQTEAEVPPKLLKAYENTLNERVAAQREYNRLKREAERTRAENPLKKPKVECTR